MMDMNDFVVNRLNLNVQAEEWVGKREWEWR